MTLTKDDIAEIVKDTMRQVNEGRPVDDTREAVREMALAITRSHAPAEPKAQPGIMAARFMRSVAAGKTIDGAARFAAKEWGEDSAIAKSLLASEAEAGGVLVPTEWSVDVIELLRERAIVRSMGPRIVPMTSGSIQIPKLTGGATASYIGEEQNIDATEPTFGQINLVWKKLACLVPISNDLLRFGAVGADSIVRDDAIGAMAQREDQAFIRGDGTEHTPRGLVSWVPAANQFDANATVNLANVTTDVASALLLLREGHSRMLTPGWLWAPRTEMYLRSVRDTNGNFAFKEEMDGGTFFGYPFGSTTEIPTNLGAGSDESQIILADFSDVIIGEANTIEVSASDQASYWDGSALQSAYSRDLTLLRVLAHHDLGVRHDESLVLIDAVTWTP